MEKVSITNKMATVLLELQHEHVFVKTNHKVYAFFIK